MKMRDLLALNEAPLADIQVHGDDLDKAGSFTKADRTYMQKAIEKQLYVKKLGRFPVDLYIYVLNKKALGKYGKLLPECLFTMAKVNNIAKLYPDIGEFIQGVFRHVTEQMSAHPRGIHFVIGDNYSDEQMPPTPWIMIHRLMHAILADDAENTDKTLDVFKIVLKMHHLSPADVLTMRSATSGRLLDDELLVEMATQYALTGDIRLNLPEAISPDDVEMIQASIGRFKAKVDKLVSAGIGKAFYI